MHDPAIPQSPPPGGHPAWCVREHCGVEHAGRPVEIRSLDLWPTVQIQLRQPRNVGSIPYVSLTAEELTVMMTVPQGRACAHILRGMCRQVAP
jgi:hypothetical protein